jgi:hypothetical protein
MSVDANNFRKMLRTIKNTAKGANESDFIKVLSDE